VIERSDRFRVDYLACGNHCQGLFEIHLLDFNHFVEIELTRTRRELAGQK
jgi:hypothetical protein